MIIQDFERPTLVMEATENPSQRRDGIREVKRTKEKIFVSKAATKVILKMKLTSSTSNCPYPWVRGDFINEQIAEGKRILRIDGMDRLPANYPREWMQTLMEFAAIVNSHSGKDNKITALEDEIASLKAQVAGRANRAPNTRPLISASAPQEKVGGKDE